MKKYQTKHYQEIKNYIDAYQADLSEEIHASQEYSFRIYLVPKLGNHQTSSDVAVEFIKYDPENPERFQGLEKQIVAIKENRTIQVANQGKYKPKDVSKIVALKIEKTFKVSDHTKAWKFYNEAFPTVRKNGRWGQKISERTDG
ncbi:MAG: hypothetical protein FWG34_14015 [Oscillospiraceae bacterium]|nr:hypothetical protein [Oscillospiraceae bacterium]